MEDPIESASVERTAPAPSAVNAALEGVLATPEFARSARLSAFLRFVVAEALAGRGDRLKAFAIAHEVFGRGESFDPQGDTIVRVEAGRLRRLLERYYLTAGREDRIVIRIPKGGYVAAFQVRGDSSAENAANADTAAPATKSQARVARTTSRPLIALGSIVTLGLIVFAGWWLASTSEPATMGVDIESVGPAPVVREKPFVAVLPLATHGPASADDILALRLVESLVTDLARASRLSAMAHSSTLGIEPDSVSLEELRREFGVSHVLRGTLETQGDKVRVQVQLVDTARKQTVWAQRYDRESKDVPDLEAELAERIVTGLTGKLDARESERLRRSRSGNREALAAFREAVTLYHPPTDPVRVAAARALYERAAEIDPDFADAFAGISQTYSLGILFGHSRSPEEDLAKAMAMGGKAVDIDASSGFAHAMLGTALVLAGKTDEGLGYARRAVAIEPGNPLAQQWLAVNLIRSDKPAEALAPIKQAFRLDPIETRQGYLNVLGFALLTLGRTEEALEAFERNRRRGGPYGPHMAALRAASYAELGRDADAREAVTLAIKASKRFSVERWLEGWMPNTARRAELLAQLYRVGLPIGG